ncbi:hypothetical protein NHX12_012852 [Muraenolepis orangiensis]|uniref:Uncharacterized protein n=1 Tax=Muraenolepis orangiensis TaxID=630683 RepID=A0A9Q0DDJ3_9TELE|nr:hypothetical protein NHX12_012852 [Muraenolepis orangiensis]
MVLLPLLMVLLVLLMVLLTGANAQKHLYDDSRLHRSEARPRPHVEALKEAVRLQEGVKAWTRGGKNEHPHTNTPCPNSWHFCLSRR